MDQDAAQRSKDGASSGTSSGAVLDPLADKAAERPLDAAEQPSTDDRQATQAPPASARPPASEVAPSHSSLPGSFHLEPTAPPAPPIKDAASSESQTAAASSNALPSSTSSAPTPRAPGEAAAAGISDDPTEAGAASLPPKRRSVYKRRSVSHPKGILKPAPPPQKGFSFRRDILQNINTRLAQQGVNVQVPVPQAGTAQATASYIGGVFRKISGFAAGAAANVSSPGFPSQDPQQQQQVQRGQGQEQQPQSSNARWNVGSKGTAPQRQGTATSTISDGGGSILSVRSTASAASDVTVSAAPLKKVQFRVQHMTVTYPIIGSGTPEDEDLTRIRIEREHHKMLRSRKSKKWTPEELEALYRDCCRTREEHPLKKMRLVFQEAAQAVPPVLRTMDLSFVPLDKQAIEPIADLLSVDFGLTKLVLENCSLTDGSLKSILHALLVSGTLPNLSLASNRKIRLNGWKYVAIFMRRAQALRYLDLSENSINKASLEHILQAVAKPAEVVTRPGRQKAGGGGGAAVIKCLETADKAAAVTDERSATAAATTGDGQEEDGDPDFDEEGFPLMPTAPLLRNVSEDAEPPASAVISLRLENCGLKTNALEMLARAVRLSEIRHLSLRRNGINQLGAVALAVLLKDYPGSLAADDDAQQQQINGGRRGENGGTLSAASGRQPNAMGVGPRAGGRGGYNGPTTAATATQRQGRPREVNQGQAYDRRQRSYSPSLPDVPLIVSSPAGGFTSRRMPSSAFADYDAGTRVASPLGTPSREIDARLTDAERSAVRRNALPSQSEEEAIALFQAKWAKRILADLPRVGNLLTLDLKSNDVRGGVVYLAQVLKKNRTLRVLNLSDNQIEMPGLVAIAEALKYNSTLETLDMSHNPCSGPGLEGLTTLRTAFTLNSNLKRLFLNGTDLSSQGAIALAEFLPEAKSLIHLDLAENFEIDIAGVMALAVSVRMNKSLRCLDLNIPPNNPDFARLSQEILQSCIRNTELAQQKATQKGLKQPIAAPIYKSVVARAAKEQDERLKAMKAARAAEGDKRKAAEELLVAAQECSNVLRDLLEGEEKRQREAPEQKVAPPGDFVEDLTKQSKRLQRRLGDLATGTNEGDSLERCLRLHDELSEVTTRLERFYRYEASPLGDPRSEEAALAGPGLSDPDNMLAPPCGLESGLSSPAFSIADSDNDDGSDDDDATAAASSHRKASSNGRHDGLEAMEGLGIDANPTPTADREEPEDGEEDGGKMQRSPSGLKAKGQLSEEGELFRKARSLMLDADDGEGDENSEGDVDVPVSGPTDGSFNDVEIAVEKPPSLSGTSLARRGSSSSSSSLSISSGSGKARRGSSSGGEGGGLDSGISGEELRKDLLTAQLPPKSARSSGGGGGVEMAEDDEEGGGGTQS